MAANTEDRIGYACTDDATPISVYTPIHVHVDVDHGLVSNVTLRLYVEMKLNAVAPWLANCSGYSNAFEEAYQLCQSGYDFNLIVYERPRGHYIACYEPDTSASTTDDRETRKKMKGFKKYWQHLRRSGRHRAPRPKYRGEILMMPGKRKWVEVYAGRFIVVPEGILRSNAAQFAL